MKKQTIDREASMDRISQLPQPLLHDILCLLSQKEAVQTSVLSKSWRYLGSTRPNLDFHDSFFRGKKEKLPSFVDKTLQRYHDQKLPIQELRLAMSGVNPKSISFLKKWIPIVLLHMGVKTFSLTFLSTYHIKSAKFKLPHVVFQSETLQSLSLYLCKLTQTPLDSVILCKHLKKLFFDRVYIGDETMAMILSSCHLIETFVVRRCEGLRNIKLDGQICLKLFDFESNAGLRKHDHSMEIDAPTLDTVRIAGFPNWFNHHNYLFPHLKSLHLDRMQFSSSSFDSFSYNFPCLEKLSLIYCYGFQEFQLSSRSIKNFKILYDDDDNPLKAVIDAPRLVRFEYRGQNIPESISFQATASEWYSGILVHCDMTVDDSAASLWCLKLYEFLKTLSESIISLYIVQEFVENDEDMEEVVQEEDGEEEEEEEETYCGLCEPVVVERLVFRLDEYSPYPSSGFIKNFKRICIRK